MKHFYEEFNEPIQKLVKLMEDDFPNGYEIVITPVGAEVRSTLTTMSFLNQRYQEEEAVPKEFRTILNEVVEKLKKEGE